MFQLSPDEAEHLRRQFGASTWGGRRYAPYAFTEQGVAMLSSVLRSKRAVLVNVEIMRAFVRLRQILASNAELARKLEALEKKYDAQFKVVFDAIRQLMAPPQPPRSGPLDSPNGKIDRRPKPARRPSGVEEDIVGKDPVEQDVSGETTSGRRVRILSRRRRRLPRQRSRLPRRKRLPDNETRLSGPAYLPTQLGLLFVRRRMSMRISPAHHPCVYNASHS